MQDGEFRRIEKTPAVQSADGDEISPFLTTVSKIEVRSRSSKAAIGRVESAMGRGNTLAGARCYVNDEAGFFSKFGRWRTGDDRHIFHSIQRDLVGENLALLVGNRLAIH